MEAAPHEDGSMVRGDRWRTESEEAKGDEDGAETAEAPPVEPRRPRPERTLPRDSRGVRKPAARSLACLRLVLPAAAPFLVAVVATGLLRGWALGYVGSVGGGGGQEVGGVGHSLRTAPVSVPDYSLVEDDWTDSPLALPAQTPSRPPRRISPQHARLISSTRIRLRNVAAKVRAWEENDSGIGYVGGEPWMRYYADKVHAMWLHAFHAYVAYAYPHDDLLPLSCGGSSDMGNMSITLLDSLDSLLVLRERRLFAEAVDLVRSSGLSFSLPEEAQTREGGTGGDSDADGNAKRDTDRRKRLDVNVSVFETTIRAVGGLVAAHAGAAAERDRAAREAGLDLPPSGFERGRGTRRGGKKPKQGDEGAASGLAALFARAPVPVPSPVPIPVRNASTSPAQKSSTIPQASLLSYSDDLLHLARDLCLRLLPAFDSPTGMPYGTINLLRGVARGEVDSTCAACVGTLAVEWGWVGVLTGEEEVEDAALLALLSLFHHRTPLGLLGSHVNITSGTWVHATASTGPDSDSAYEYACKTYWAFADEEGMGAVCDELYRSVRQHLKRGLLHLDADSHTGAPATPFFHSLGAFYPGLKVQRGDLLEALDEIALARHVAERVAQVNARALRDVPAPVHAGRRFRPHSPRWGAPVLPEQFDLRGNGSLIEGRWRWPLRPEFVESAWHAYRASGDAELLGWAGEVAEVLEGRARVPCGYAGVKNVGTMELEDKMESFLLSETLKYLYLLFNPSNPYNGVGYVYTTEAHPLPVVDRSLWHHGQFRPSRRATTLRERRARRLRVEAEAIAAVERARAIREDEQARQAAQAARKVQDVSKGVVEAKVGPITLKFENGKLVKVEGAPLVSLGGSDGVAGLLADAGNVPVSVDMQASTESGEDLDDVVAEEVGGADEQGLDAHLDASPADGDLTPEGEIDDVTDAPGTCAPPEPLEQTATSPSMPPYSSAIHFESVRAYRDRADAAWRQGVCGKREWEEAVHLGVRGQGLGGWRERG